MVNLDTVLCKPLKGSSYTLLISGVASKKAPAKLRNDDAECLKWSITRALNPTNSHPERITRAVLIFQSLSMLALW